MHARTGRQVGRRIALSSILSAATKREGGLPFQPSASHTGSAADSVPPLAPCRTSQHARSNARAGCLHRTRAWWAPLPPSVSPSLPSLVPSLSSLPSPSRLPSLAPVPPTCCRDLPDRPPDQKAVVQRVELLALGQLVGGGHRRQQRHAHARAAVVKHALVDEREQRVEDGAVGLEDLVNEGHLPCSKQGHAPPAHVSSTPCQLPLPPHWLL